MIRIQLRVEHQKGVMPDYSEAFGSWEVNTPVTSDEYERFCEELDKAKKDSQIMHEKTRAVVNQLVNVLAARINRKFGKEV